MGSVTSLRKAGAAGQRAPRLRTEQREASRPASDASAMPVDGPISLAAALASIMLSLDPDRVRNHQSGG